jgi:hypothetical protein
VKEQQAGSGKPSIQHALAKTCVICAAAPSRSAGGLLLDFFQYFSLGRPRMNPDNAESINGAFRRRGAAGGQGSGTAARR